MYKVKIKKEDNYGNWNKEKLSIVDQDMLNSLVEKFFSLSLEERIKLVQNK